MLVSLRKSLVVVLFASLFLVRFAGLAFAAAGDLDTSFSGDGKLTTNFTSGDDLALGLAFQGDGKPVVAGRSAAGGGSFAVTRYNLDGTLDTDFSGDGKLTIDFTSGDDFAEDVAIDSGGNIVLVGRAGGFGGRFAVARVDSSGVPDTSFSGDGKLTTNFTSGDDVAFGVAIDGSDNIIAAGGADGSNFTFALARYLGTDGSLDSSFDGDGKLTTNFTTGDDFAEDVAIDFAGNIVAAGRAGGFGGRFAFARYDSSDGSLDSNFSGDGKRTVDFSSSSDDLAFAVTIDGGGDIVAAGRAGGLGGRFGLTRLLSSDGSLDTSFSGDGKQTTNFTSGEDVAFGVAVQIDGEIVAAGGADGSDVQFALARYDNDGGLDGSFSGDGKLRTNFTAGTDYATDVGVDFGGTGDIVAVGRAGGFGGRFAVAAYQSGIF